MKKINLEILRDPISYDIIIDNDLIANLNNFIISSNQYSRIVVIHDSIIDISLIEELTKIFNNSISIPIDLTNNNKKSIDQFVFLQEQLINHNIDKNVLVISIGGGSIGDLVGFVASTYHRGVDYIQVPTTLLSMIDSSIGGKTGLDLERGKNLIGSFYHPKAVFINTNFLKTLNKQEITSGIFEAIKYGIACDNDFFYFIQNNIDHLYEEEALYDIIEWCCRIKADIIIKDEKDGNIRNKLNFGHTIGHPIESIYGIRHGEAVAFGMLFATKLSRNMNTINDEESSRIINLINHFDIPIFSIDIDQILNKLNKDKKRINSKNNFILLNGIGSSYISNDVKINQIKEVLLDL